MAMASLCPKLDCYQPQARRGFRFLVIMIMGRQSNQGCTIPLYYGVRKSEICLIRHQQVIYGVILSGFYCDI